MASITELTLVQVNPFGHEDHLVAREICATFALHIAWSLMLQMQSGRAYSSRPIETVRPDANVQIELLFEAAVERYLDRLTNKDPNEMSIISNEQTLQLLFDLYRIGNITLGDINSSY